MYKNITRPISDSFKNLFDFFKQYATIFLHALSKIFKALNNERSKMNQHINIDDLILHLAKMKEFKSMPIFKAKELFFIVLKENNTNPNTIKYYENSFYKLDYFIEKFNVSETKDVTDDFLRLIISNGLDMNLSENYINKITGTAKTMIHRLAEAGYIDDVLFKVKKLKVPEKRLNTITNENQLVIFNNLSKFSLKDQLIICILFDSGIRRNELANIKLENIDLITCSMYLTVTKTGVPRIAFFTKTCKNILLDYLKQYHPKKYLFEGNIPGNPIAPRSISNRLEKIKKCLNLDSLSAHQFRHTFATNVYDSSHDIELTRELCGHAQYTMTKRYVHQTSQKLKIEYDKIESIVNHSINNIKKSPDGN